MLSFLFVVYRPTAARGRLLWSAFFAFFLFAKAISGVNEDSVKKVFAQDAAAQDAANAAADAAAREVQVRSQFVYGIDLFFFYGARNAAQGNELGKMKPQQRNDGKPRGNDDNANDHDGDMLAGRQTQNGNGNDKEQRIKDGCQGDRCQYRSQIFDKARLLLA